MDRRNDTHRIQPMGENRGTSYRERLRLVLGRHIFRARCLGLRWRIRNGSTPHVLCRSVVPKLWRWLLSNFFTGYAGYYGLSIIVASYPVLFASFAAHAAQFAFLVFFENPRKQSRVMKFRRAIELVHMLQISKEHMVNASFSPLARLFPQKHGFRK